MYQMLEGKAEIAKAQRALEASIRRDFRQRATRNIGYPGGTEFGAKVATDGRYWHWSADFKQDGAKNPRRLNWFGLMSEGRDLEITVEINTAYVDRNNFVAGFFARNSDTGRIYLFHTGRVGGGKKGVNKEALLTYAGHELIDVVDGDGGTREGILVMPVEAAGATRSAIRYVQGIADFKLAVREGETSTPAFMQRKQALHDFYQEGRGRRKSEGRGKALDYVSRHGEVVDALHAWRKANGLAKGQRLVKNVLIDLGVQAQDGLAELYEVKTSTFRGDVYTAIGQLAVHSPHDGCKRFAVLPDDKLAKDLTEGLSRSGISVIRYRLTEDAAVILE